MIKLGKYSKFSFMFFFILILIISFLIIKPFIVVIFSGVLVAYIFYPVYKRFNKKIKRENLSAFLLTILILALILVPTALFVSTISDDIMRFYLSSKQVVAGKLFYEECETDSFVCNTIDYAKEIIANPTVNAQIKNSLSKVASYLFDLTSEVVVSIPKVILNIIILLFVVFYSFRDGKDAWKKALSLIPLKSIFKKQLETQTKDLIYATVYGNIVMAVVQGLLGMIGFLIFGVPSPVLWGFVMIFAALLPFVGSALVWFPAVLYLLLLGYIQTDTTMIWKGVGLFLYGFLFISMIDNILKPKIIGDRTKLHPLLILLGIFGGLALMGILGLILGPLILAFLVSFVKVYEIEKDEILS
jgi:predicted PurR-regulated permease PerM